MKIIAVCLTTIMFLLSGVAYAGTYIDSAHGQNIKRSPLTGDPKYNPGVGGFTTGNCAHCHEQHASLGGVEPAPQKPGPDKALLFDQEEALCEACHDIDGPATDNIKTQMGKASAHPTDNISGKHKVSESTTTNMAPNDYATGNRHAECVDCHNPHTARSTKHTLGTNAVSSTSPLYKVSGIEPTNSFAWVAPTYYTEIPASTGITKEYQLCFKCHSSWTTQGGTQTDIALQFNTRNASMHPVEAGLDSSSSSKLTTSQMGASWQNVGTQTMYCSDCHGSETSGDPAGPHGSTTKDGLTIPKILKGRWPMNSVGYLWKISDAIAGANNFDAECLCKKCHPIFSGGTYKNNVHSLGSTGFIHDVKCVVCHVGLPHGSAHSRLIAYKTDTAPYNYGGNTAEMTRFNKRADSQNYLTGDCADPKPNTCPYQSYDMHP